jgi:regulator of sirC expression with transglutaminase-like and TPR domain
LSDPDPGARARGPANLREEKPAAPSPRGEAPDPERLRALVGLLADESETVRRSAADALRTAGARAAQLREHAEALEDPALRSRVRGRLEAYRIEELERELEDLARRGAPLEPGAFLLARVVYPDLDPLSYSARLDAMAEELRGRIPAQPLRAKARALVDFLHSEHGFRGTDSYDDPENALLNRVLDRRTGIPTSLACVYLLIAKRLGLPLEGVNLPLHFLVRYGDGDDETFIDAFAGGRFLTRGDCRQFLRGAGIEERPEFLRSASDRVVLSRLARSLAESYRARGSAALAARFERCLAIVGSAPAEGPS